MRSLVLDYQRHELLMKEVPDPELQASSQLLLRILEVGVCGTDRELANFRLGFPPPGSDYLVIGHEAFAQVTETGQEVNGIERGDFVVPMVRRRCSPPCYSCARNRRDLCFSPVLNERGIFGLHGYFAEYAVDDAADLVRVPGSLVDYAVLMEPLSVVEKAVEMALRVHEPGYKTGLVLGAGTIGLLAALVLQVRGLRVALHSIESADDPRAKVVRDAGIEYLPELSSHHADVVIEATGSAEAAFRGLHHLAPLGVCVILGSPNAVGEFPFRELITHNRTVLGSVNASPQAFSAAVEDLAVFDKRILGRLIHRLPVHSFMESILGPPGPHAKLVHMIAG